MDARSRNRQLLRIVGAFGAVAALLLAAEGYLRWLHTPSPGFTALLFHTELNVERWAYLDAAGDRLRVEELLVLDPDEDTVERVEPGRPPFDRIEQPFHVRTNHRGFRERALPDGKAPGVRRALLLGDSVGWGKGVERADRYADLVGARAPEHVELFDLAFQGFTSGCIGGMLDIVWPLEPDLLLLQASSNDTDQTLWRLADGDARGGASRLSQRWASRSRTALAARYLLFGDPYPDQLARAHAAAAEHYRRDLTDLFSACRERGVPVVVLRLPLASAEVYGEHVVDACGQESDVCLGTVDGDFARPDRWLDDWPAVRERLAAEPDFVTRTAAEMGIDEARLATVFPYRYLFHDVVHPDEAGHALFAAQLESFLAERWDGWQPVDQSR